MAYVGMIYGGDDMDLPKILFTGSSKDKRCRIVLTHSCIIVSEFLHPDKDAMGNEIWELLDETLESDILKQYIRKLISESDNSEPK